MKRQTHDWEDESGCVRDGESVHVNMTDAAAERQRWMEIVFSIHK
jgi:hypothetical protein